MTGQGQDVAGAITQRAQLQADHVQPVVQILAEMAGVDGFLQLHVGRCQHPHVNGNALARTQAHHFALLQHPQQLDLNGHRQITDFIEEQGAAIGLLEPAGLGAEGAGESAFFVAEQLGLDQGFRERTAVHRHKRPVAPGAEVVDMACHQLLAGAGFANDQHTGFARGDLLQVGEQGLGFRVFEHLGRGADRRGQSGRGR